MEWQLIRAQVYGSIYFSRYAACRIPSHHTTDGIGMVYISSSYNIICVIKLYDVWA